METLKSLSFLFLPFSIRFLKDPTVRLFSSKRSILRSPTTQGNFGDGTYLDERVLHGVEGLHFPVQNVDELRRAVEGAHLEFDRKKSSIKFTFDFLSYQSRIVK